MNTTQQSEQSTDALLSIEQAAVRLGVSAMTVRRKLDTGELPSYRIGRQIRIAESDVNRLIQSHRVKVP